MCPVVQTVMPALKDSQEVLGQMNLPEIQRHVRAPYSLLQRRSNSAGHVFEYCCLHW